MRKVKRPDTVLRNKSQENREKVRKAMLGRKHTQETRDKISQGLFGNKRHLGCKHSPEAIEKIKEARKKQVGENHPMWKGDNVGYVALHDWVRGQNGRPVVCETCKTTSTERSLEWVNKDHLYRRNIDDFMSLCRSCHRKYDIENNNYKTPPMRALGYHNG